MGNFDEDDYLLKCLERQNRMAFWLLMLCVVVAAFGVLCILAAVKWAVM